jgi:Flp pilus assembly pilin Flp
MQTVTAQFQPGSAEWHLAGRRHRGHLLAQGCLPQGCLAQGYLPQASLLGEQRGVVFVEYVIVLVLVSALGVAGIIPLGLALSHYFKAQQTVLSLPFP